ncbi:unnamed protein product [Rotaria sp. Silwood1]|nr:unnamed protein product [Rotaria sp. Silwood1]
MKPPYHQHGNQTETLTDTTQAIDPNSMIDAAGEYLQNPMARMRRNTSHKTKECLKMTVPKTDSTRF